MEVHGYTRGGSIETTIDGARMTVPDDMGNRHRILIDEWEFVTTKNGTRNRVNTVPAWVPPGLTAAEVDAERDKRIASGFIFNGNKFQSRPNDLQNIQGAVSAANVAVISGAQVGNNNWADPSTPFAWLNASNQPIVMDAHTFGQLGMAVMAHKSFFIWKGREIKDALLAGNPPADVTNDAIWL
jgi:hypothetical protein